jgi:hypothetical protein
MRILIILSLFVSSSIAVAEPTISLLNMSDIHGKRTEYPVDLERLARTPEWTPGMQDPPLAVSAACRIAAETGKRRLPKADDISIQSITLRNTEYHSGRTESGPADIVRWHYEISVAPIIGGETFFGASSTIIVLLMDGTIIEPAFPE